MTLQAAPLMLKRVVQEIGRLEQELEDGKIVESENDIKSEIPTLYWRFLEIDAKTEYGSVN